MEEKNIKNISIANSILLPEIVKLLTEGHTVTLLLKGCSMRPFLENVFLQRSLLAIMFFID